MKTLELVGLENYNGRKTNGTCIGKGQVITVNDADAEYMLREENAEVVKGVVTPHWVEIPYGSKDVDHHFATEEPTAEQVEDGEKAAAAEEDKPKARGGQRSRTPRAAAK